MIGDRERQKEKKRNLIIFVFMFIAFAGYCLSAITNSVSYPVLCLNDFVYFDNAQKNGIVFFSRWFFSSFVCWRRKKLQNWLNIYFQFCVWHWFAWIVKSFIECGIYFHFSFFNKSLNRWKNKSQMFSLQSNSDFIKLVFWRRFFSRPSTHKHTHFLLYAISFYNIPEDWFRSLEPKLKKNRKWRME